MEISVDFSVPILKKTGYDGVVITGCAERPSYIWIHDGKAEIKDASGLWERGPIRYATCFVKHTGIRTVFLPRGQPAKIDVVMLH